MEGWPPAVSQDHTGTEVKVRFELRDYAVDKLVRGVDFCGFILDEFHFPIYDATLLSVTNMHMYYTLWSELYDADR
jgi:hypothetical protein